MLLGGLLMEKRLSSRDTGSRVMCPCHGQAVALWYALGIVYRLGIAERILSLHLTRCSNSSGIFGHDNDSSGIT